MKPRRFVYILRSDTDRNRHYVGLTSVIRRRLTWHNSGPSGVTLQNRPWSLVVSPAKGPPCLPVSAPLTSSYAPR